MPANAITVTTSSVTAHRAVARGPATGRRGRARTAVRTRPAVAASCGGPGPGPRPGVRSGVRCGVRLEPDPRTDTPRHPTAQVNRPTGEPGDDATNPCRGFPRGAYPGYSPPGGAVPARAAGRGQPW